MVKIFIVEDHPIMRQSLRALLERETDLVVGGEAGSGEKARLCAEFTQQYVRVFSPISTQQRPEAPFNRTIVPLSSPGDQRGARHSQDAVR